MFPLQFDSSQIDSLLLVAFAMVLAAVGIAVALSQFLLAIGVTIVALITLTGIQVIERRMDGQ